MTWIEFQLKSEPVWYVCDQNPDAYFVGFSWWIPPEWSLNVEISPRNREALQ